MAHIQTTAVVRATKKVVARLNSLVHQSLRPRIRFLVDRPPAAAGATGAAPRPPVTGSIRVFISMFPVAYRPDSMFADENGVLEAAVIAAAVPMIECFDDMCDWFVQDPPPVGGLFATMPEVTSFCFVLFCVGLALQTLYHQVLVRSYPDFQTRYYDAFAAWKTPEAAMLIPRIADALVMLRLSALAIPAAVPQDDPRRFAFQRDIEMLRARLLTVGGQAGRDALAHDLALAEAEAEAEADELDGEDEDQDDDEEDFEGNGLHENTDGDLPY